MYRLNNSALAIQDGDGDSCNIRAFIETLRNAIPPEDHPNKNKYSYKEIISLFTPNMKPVDAVDYGEGETRCICGHKIRDIFMVSYTENTSIKVWPIGSVCIKRFFNSDFLYLKTIVDNIDLQKLYNNEYTFADFNKKTGFTKDSADMLLEHGIISHHHYYFLLKDIIKRRKPQLLGISQSMIMYRIMLQIHEALAAYK